MFKNFCTSLLLLISLFRLDAQNPGCDGTRYKDDVFANAKMTSVTYAPSVTVLGGDVNLVMDVYEPLGDSISERPVVVLAHGGSFLFGDRTMMASYCELLAKKAMWQPRLNTGFIRFSRSGPPIRSIFLMMP